MKFDQFPLDIKELIGIYIDFEYLKIYFEKVPQLRYSEKFWFKKLNYMVNYYQQKYPKLYKFDCTIPRQEYVYKTLLKEYNMIDSYLISVSF
jgi:hypothetical protein